MFLKRIFIAFKGAILMTKKLMLSLMATMMVSATALANPFDDVPKDHWAYDAVESLAASGIIDGYGDNTFRGDRPGVSSDGREAD